MFYPLAMRHVMIELLESDLPQAALALARIEVFAPDPHDETDHGLQQIPGQEFRRLHQQASTRLEKIVEHLPDATPAAAVESKVLTLDELAQLNQRLGDLWQECSTRQEALRALDEQQGQVGYLQDTLDLFANLGVDLRVLDRHRPFIDLRVGTVSRFNLERMRDALGLSGYLVYPFLAREDAVHVVVAGPRGDAVARVDAVLESAGFHDLPVPAELQDEPERVRRVLQQRLADIAEQRRAVLDDIGRCAQANAGLLGRARSQLDLARPFVEIDGAARVSRRLAVLSGWVPARALPQVESALQAALQHPYLLEARRPRGGEYPRVPTLLSEHRWLAPFADLVRQYGVPGYGEIDPSLVFAVTFILMFGMMFGDVGHGAVIALASLMLHRRLGRFTGFGVAAGLSSAGFGFVYGSVFGFEEWVHPLWMSPMSDPVLLLKVALGWGIGFLLLMTLLHIHNRLRIGDIAGALMDTHGVNNLLLYAGLLWLVWNLVRGAGTGVPLLMLVAALAVLIVYKWQHSGAPRGERVMVVAVECFEAIMGNVSGTLSFLRVAAFSINHVALAVAVFTLADLMGPTGHWLMVIGGNLFILVLEGAIVAIQALRLEYYEGFSRFFTGDGRPFQPLRLPAGLPPGPIDSTSIPTASIDGNLPGPSANLRSAS